MATKKLLLSFSKSETEKTILYHLIKDFNLVINIFRAKITPEEEGFLVLEVSGEEKDIEASVEFIAKNGVSVNHSGKGLQRDNEKCVHCGNCLSHCPTKALYVLNPLTREVGFNDSLCIECLSCVRNCPFGACYSLF